MSNLLTLGAGSRVFSPNYVSGLQLWLRADSGVNTDGAAQFNAGSSRYLSRASNSTLQINNSDFFFACWVYLDDKSNYRLIASKDDAGGNREWFLDYDLGLDRFNFIVLGAGAATYSAAWSSAPSTATWYHVTAWYDSVNHTANISVNNGTPVSTSTGADTISSSSAEFQIGAYGGGLHFDGRIDEACFGKPSGIAGQVAGLRSSLYNTGSGKTYADLTGTEKTNWGLVSFWDLDETTGTRNDSHGTNHLTSNNSVGSATGKVQSSSVTDGDPVYQWDDQSGNSNHATQGTAAKKPLYKASVINSLPVIRGDGVDDYLGLSSAIALVGDFSVFIVGSRSASDKMVMFGSHTVNACLTHYTDSNIYFVNDAASAINSSSADTATGPYLLEFIRSGSTCTAAINGTNKPMSGTLSGTITLKDLFARFATGDYQSGDMASILVYDSALAGTNLAGVRGYFTSKYAL